LIKSCPSITRQELADKLGLSPDGIKYHLQKMKLNGLIHHIGSTKAGRWEVLKLGHNSMIIRQCLGQSANFL